MHHASLTHQHVTDTIMYLQVTVLRDGGVKDISIFDLLVGDVMLFETGDIVPADGIIITGNTIRYPMPLRHRWGIHLD